MVPLSELWLPIVLSAVFVFVVSSILHIVLPYHRSDYRKLPAEDSAMAALRTPTLTPGLYMFPHCSHKEMNTPEAKARFTQGPVGTLTILPTGVPVMPKYLAKWFGYCLLIGLFAAYIAGRTLAPGTDYLQVFRVVGATSFMAFGLGPLANAIWKGMPLGVVAKEVIDGLIYCGVAGGTFGWLWPR